ncbi:MAG: hypothetical protein MUF15_21155 [Acidobacteria bacterium]|nr:hypothetical protein [Acidobacteriota bacterium]
MQLVCVAEINAKHEIKLAEKIKKKLHPGERIRIKIESMAMDTQERRSAIARLKEIGSKSKLGLYKEVIGREDAHERDVFLET